MTNQQRARVLLAKPAIKAGPWYDDGAGEAPDMDNTDEVCFNALTAADAPLRELIKRWREHKTSYEIVEATRPEDKLYNRAYESGETDCADELEAIVMPGPGK
jgi:hypothetical protein